MNRNFFVPCLLCSAGLVSILMTGCAQSTPAASTQADHAAFGGDASKMSVADRQKMQDAMAHGAQQGSQPPAATATQPPK